MKNNGYTKIPNAIIRLAVITPGERSAWCLIASLPKGYALSIGDACVMLGINQKTWRQCVAGLKRRNMITVEPVPGHANVYNVTPAENWDTTPAKNWYTQKTAGVPKNGSTPIPKNGRGTHTNNKERIKNNTTTSITCARTREKLVAELLTDGRIELAMMQHRITEQQYRQFIDEIIADWQFRGLPDSDYNLNHFSSVLRYKVASINRNNGNNPKSGQQIDPRVKLAQDAVKAMAALAEESRHPAQPTW
jgi:hypothetical protein